MYKSYFEEINKETEEIICKMTETKDFGITALFFFPLEKKKFFHTAPELWCQEKDMVHLVPL